MVPTTFQRHAGPFALQHYTLLFKNGQQLRHQEPLALAQFRSDGRLERFWLEPPSTTDQLPSSSDASSC
jgi:hypothetical protein